jgi:hypothetical protein
MEFLATENPIQEAGTIEAELGSIELRQSKRGFVREDGSTAPPEYYSLKFKLLGKEHKGEYLYGTTSTSFGKKSKLRKLAEGILGRKIATGERITPDDLIGVPCTLVVDVEEDSDGDPRNVITNIWSLKMPQPKEEAPGAPPLPTLEELFEENTELAGLIRRYEAAKASLGWKPNAYKNWIGSALGYTAEQIANRPGPFTFSKLAVEVQRQVVTNLERAAETPDQYDTDGDLKFN